jgi:hypothetical protein
VIGGLVVAEMAFEKIFSKGISKLVKSQGTLARDYSELLSLLKRKGNQMLEL